MTIDKTTNGDKLEFTLSGRLDAITCTELQEVLIPAFDENPHVVLDFKELEYISSAGLRTLLMGQKTAKAKAGTMILRNVSAEIMEIFEMTGFSNVLSIQ